MEREKKLISNLMLFAAGNMGSKLLQFLLVPFYTGVLNTEEYGTVDILQTGASLIIPIFSLTIAESVFRYGMEKANNKKSVFSTGIYVVTVGSIALAIIGLLTQNWWGTEKAGIWLMMIYSICNMYRNISSQFLRAIGKVKIFTIDNIVQTLSILCFNILFLAWFKLGVMGYMLGYILGNLLSFCFGIVAGKLWKYLCSPNIPKKIIKEMLIFSIPLIPNTICWWISSSTDRIMIVGWIGKSANGLYSVAHKIPSILSILVTIFVQAWQISANEEFEKGDRSEFYSKVFEVLAVFCFIGSSLLMLFSKIETRIIASRDYYESWSVMVALIIGMTFFSFAQFLGTIYTANKKTAMAFATNMISAIVNVVLNMIFIPKYGAQGAAIATSISYLVLWISRIITTDKIVHIQMRVKEVILSSVLIVVQGAVQILEVPYWQILGTGCLLGLVVVNYSLVCSIVKAGYGMMKEKVGHGKK